MFRVVIKELLQDLIVVVPVATVATVMLVSVTMKTQKPKWLYDWLRKED